MKKIILTLFLIQFFVPSIKSADAGGENGFSFLEINPYARSAAMADARAARVGDLSMLYTNPAGIAHVRHTEVGFHHVSYLEDTTYENISMVRPYRHGAWGVHIGIYSISDITQTRVDSSVIDGFVESGKIRAQGQLISFGYGMRQSRDLVLGGNLKLVKEDLDSESATSGMIDFGGIYRIDSQWRAALLIQNLGTPAKFISKSFNPPTKIRLGIYYALEDWIRFEMDALRFFTGETELLLGGELEWEDYGLVRFGYRYQSKQTDLDVLAGATVGIGTNFRNFYFDYAFSPFEDLGDTHRVSLSWKFFSKGEYLRQKKKKTHENSKGT